MTKKQVTDNYVSFLMGDWGVVKNPPSFYRIGGLIALPDGTILLYVNDSTQRIHIWDRIYEGVYEWFRYTDGSHSCSAIINDWVQHHITKKNTIMDVYQIGYNQVFDVIFL